MKSFIVFLIVALVTLFMWQGVAGIFDLFKQPDVSTAPTVDFVTSVEQRHKPAVAAYQASLASDPASYTAQVNLANEYYNWADELSRPQTGQSQPTTAAMQVAFEQWGLAKAAYDTATKMTKTFDAPTQTDRSYATLQTNDATGAIKIATEVTKKAPTFAQGWAHLGLYYEAIGMNPQALAALKKYVALNPKDQMVDDVKKRIEVLSRSVVTTKSPTP
jgi:tetratricopeptide (TPR) repeat protein